jgi:tetratricopeptide (TPR) repeat protein
MWHRIITALFTVILFAATPAHAAYDDELLVLQQRWAATRYQTSGDEQKNQLKKLVDDMDTFVKKNPDKADGYIWAAVARGSLAEAINGMSALGIVKEAKENLEKAIAIDPKAEDAYAYGVLGLMYSKVPGWPISFGDKKKAQELLRKGIELSPDGMNVNYLYAQYLFEQGDYKPALPAIEKAAQATPPREADTSLVIPNRQREIRELTDKIKAKLK